MFAKQLMTRKDKKMAKKGKTIFVCQECGYESTKWMGRCICGAWNSMVEEKQIDLNTDDKRRRTGTAASVKGTTEGGGRAAGKPSRLSQVTSGETSRIDTGIGELNRVLGGGLVPGSLTLISGEPGIGKSTIIIDVYKRQVKVGMIRILIREKEELRHERIEPDRKEKGHEHGQDCPRFTPLL